MPDYPTYHDALWTINVTSGLGRGLVVVLQYILSTASLHSSGKNFRPDELLSVSHPNFEKLVWNHLEEMGYDQEKAIMDFFSILP